MELNKDFNDYLGMGIKKDLKTQLLLYAIQDYIYGQIDKICNEANSIVEATATKALTEIQEIISDDRLDDFLVVEKIIQVFEKYKLDCGGRHDFG